MTESVTVIPPNYALIYAKLARHVAAADALLGRNSVYDAAEELSEEEAATSVALDDAASEPLDDESTD